jgi:hypothetical protein
LKPLTEAEDLAPEQSAAVWHEATGSTAPSIAGTGAWLDQIGLTLDDRYENAGLRPAATACDPVLDPA